ncbi:phosphomevalonate kinase [Nocardia sp. NPDC052316]|uniref:phosphomevalonate kinase n=1 Tax=Nocardia sp. NPDC052316 TaxID=3364329 RepID=UPI0037C7618E
MIAARAPGKLMIAGEYAVVEPGQPAVVVTVDRWVEVRVRAVSGPDTTVRSDLTKNSIRCRRTDGGLTVDGTSIQQLRSVEFVLAALTVVTDLLSELGAPTPAVDLTISSTLTHHDGRKYGLGSSAAVTVATITALGRFHGLNLTDLERYQLAVLASATVDPESSSADLAACVWGGWLAFCAPNRQYIARVRREQGVEAALGGEWPGLAIRHLPPPTSVRLLVGWTGSPASTREMVAARPACLANSKRFRRFLDASAANVASLIDAIDTDDSDAIRAAIHRARELLAELDAVTGIGIMTSELGALCAAADAVGAAAKPAGAGGGDCGIAVLDSNAEYRADDLYCRWVAGGIHPLPLRIGPTVGSNRDYC